MHCSILPPFAVCRGNRRTGGDDDGQMRQGRKVNEGGRTAGAECSKAFILFFFPPSFSSSVFFFHYSFFPFSFDLILKALFVCPEFAELLVFIQHHYINPPFSNQRALDSLLCNQRQKTRGSVWPNPVPLIPTPNCEQYSVDAMVIVVFVLSSTFTLIIWRTTKSLII